jgi:DNA-binding HxlR family transcriptional regulator
MSMKKAYACCIDTVTPVRDALGAISGKWKLPIIISVGAGNERFTDIQKSIPGITPKVLAKELKELERHRLVKRTVIDDYPVKIRYEKSAYADTLAPVIQTLRQWGLSHQKELGSEDR